MLDVYQRATQARQLAEYEPFQVIADEIKSAALELFLNPASDIKALTEAHEAIRAVETFMATIQRRLDAETIARKKDQDRNGSD